MNRNGISTTQLAKICGVSQGTVDRALNNRKGINKETKEKVLAVAKEYGYRHSPQVRGAVRQQLKTIGVVLSDLKNENIVSLTDKLQQEALSRGFSTVVMFSSDNIENELKSILALYHMGIAGLIFIPVNNGEDFKKFLWSLDLPVLTLNEQIDSIPFMGNFEVPNDTAVNAALAYIIDGTPFPFDDAVEN